MKNYRVSVNGKSYDVTVEELAAAEGAPVVNAAPSAPSKPAAPSGASGAAAPQVASSGGPQTVKAPMPGTVISIKVTAGQAVKKGDILLILEAMKMENEITAPSNGTVAKIHVAAHTSVNTGDELISLS